ncbi:hypothetical protein [Mucilaginibacter lacusdianchii]|uniref:hypothetical protein n=1 Tax=Mucilaginibacter lacusdianchii TaxID=2684211 RepID=UPI00131BC824|nr:hypothetical protein [Mucilaginibacter sp. JXJ CY 39]
MKTKYFIVGLSFILFLALNVSCKKSNDDSSENPPLEINGVQLSDNARFGKILTDNSGRSLYFFSNDAGLTSTCNNGCAVVWPVFYKSNPAIGTGLSSSDFGEITRTDGTKQTTYKGWPLYYYQNDKASGDVGGDGVGNNWFVAKADYSVMVAYAQLIGHDGAQYNSQGVAGQENSQYLTDPYGRTLYLFSRDTYKKNTFSNNDPTHDAIWPLYAVNSIQSVPSILDKTQFDVITVFDKSQLVYKGHPLYYFGQDNGLKGSTKGVSFPVAGSAIWKINNLTTAALSN